MEIVTRKRGRTSASVKRSAAISRFGIDETSQLRALSSVGAAVSRSPLVSRQLRYWPLVGCFPQVFGIRTDAGLQLA